MFFLSVVVWCQPFGEFVLFSFVFYFAHLVSSLSNPEFFVGPLAGIRTAVSGIAYCLAGSCREGL